MELAAEGPGYHVTTILPGVVATDFGVNAVHGGPDSRAMPGAQPVEEVAAAIADVIEHPRSEVYTRPGFHDQVAAYYAAPDPAVLERDPPFATPR
jgi:hypothetical protein